MLFSVSLHAVEASSHLENNPLPLHALAEFICNLLQEAEMLSQVGDSRLVTRLQETIRWMGTVNFLTDFCAGGSLAEKVQREGPLPSSAAAKILTTLAEFAELCIHKGRVLPRCPQQFGIAKYRTGIDIVACR